MLIILKPNLTVYSTSGLIKATNLPDFLFNLFVSMPLIFILFLKKNRKSIGIAIISIIFLSYSLYFDTRYFFYEPKTKEVGDYINKHTNESDIIISPKVIGYYSQRRYHINDNHKPPLNPSLNFIKGYIIKSYEDPLMKSEFFWQNGLYGDLISPLPSIEELKKSRYIITYYESNEVKPIKTIGDFYIYKLDN